MTFSKPQSHTPAATFGWALADAWTIARRDLQHWRLQPSNILLGWFFPVMILIMFGSFFGGAISVPNGGNYFDFLLPGMLTLTMLFGLESTQLAVATDAAKGITDRFRSMPISASVVVLGRCIADMLNSIVGLVVMVGAGLLLGWRWYGGVGDALLAFALLLLLRFALLWGGIFMGLSDKNPAAIASVQILIWPFSFLSSIFVDPSTMPAWLGTIAEWNPLSAVATATRQLFGNQGWQSDSWAGENALLLALVWCSVIIIIFLPLSVQKYRNLRR